MLETQKAKLNLKAGANVSITAVEDALNNRVDYIITSLGGAIPVSSLTAATGTNTIDNLAHKQTWQWNSLTSGGGLLIESNSTSAIAGEALVEIKRSGATTGYKTVTLKLSNANTNGTPIALEIEAIGGGYPIGINFKPSATPYATQINLEYSPYGGNTGINMGNQYVKFGGGGVTVIGTDGGTTMRYNCNGGQHLFGTTGSYKFGIMDYVFGYSSPFTIYRRNKSILWNYLKKN